MFLVDDDPGAIDAHHRGLGINAQTLLRDDFTVDLDATGRDQFLGAAPRCDAGLRQHLLQTQFRP